MTGFGDVNVGDKVRLTAIGEYPEMHELVVADIQGSGDNKIIVSHWTRTYYSDHWSVEVLEPAPKPLPTEPGVYQSNYGTLYDLSAGGRWFRVRDDYRTVEPDEFADVDLVRLVPESAVEEARNASEQDAKTAWSLYRTEQAEVNRQSKIADKLSDAIEAVRALVMNTDGDYLASEDFDGLAGCIQQALAEHGFREGKS